MYAWQWCCKRVTVPVQATLPVTDKPPLQVVSPVTPSVEEHVAAPVTASVEEQVVAPVTPSVVLHATALLNVVPPVAVIVRAFVFVKHVIRELKFVPVLVKSMYACELAEAISMPVFDPIASCPR
jgi:hypothetical protein